MGIFSHDEDPDWNTVYSYKDRAEKYKSALEEIRIYINRCRDSHCDSNCEYWDNCKGNYNIDNILDKINEVLQ